MYVWYGANKEMAGDPCDSFTYVFLQERVESLFFSFFFRFLQMYLVIRDVWARYTCLCRVRHTFTE